MKLNKITQLTALSAALFGTSAFAASNDALLELLVEKGVLTQTEATTVAEELAADQPVYITPKSDAIKELKLTGRLHFQYDNISNDSDDDDYNDSRDRFSFRRLYLGAEAKFYEDYYGKLILNFGDTDSEADVDKAVIGWKYESFANFEAGYTKVPFGFYETTSSSKIKTVERSIANRTFNEGDGLAFGARQTGIFAKGDLGGGFAYKAAVVSAEKSNSRSDDTRKGGDQEGYGFFARLQWESEESDNGGQLLVGTDLGYTQDGSVNTNGDGDLAAYGLHANYSLGGFNISAEGLVGLVEDNNMAGGDADVMGFTIQPSYKINDKWEVVASYSYVESDDAYLIEADDTLRKSGVKAYFDEASAYYIGFNYFIVGNDLKLSGGYEFGDFEDSYETEDTEIDAFRLRLQMLF